ARLLERWAKGRASARAPYRAASIHASLAGQSVADRCSSRSYALSLSTLRLCLRREDRAGSDRPGSLGHTRSGLSSLRRQAVPEPRPNGTAVIVAISTVYRRRVV